MTIDELKAAKSDLRDAFIKLINDFEKLSGATVERINIERHDVHKNFEDTGLSSVLGRIDIEVRI